MNKKLIITALSIVLLTFLSTNIYIGPNINHGMTNNTKNQQLVIPEGKITSKYSQKNILLLPVDFPDQPNTTTTNSIYSTWYNGTKSVSNYFYNQSYGNLNLTVQIQPWITSSEPIVYYANKLQQATLEPELIQYVMNYWDPSLNYTQFDYVIVIYAGPDENTNSTFMPHIVESTFTTNEKTFNQSALVGETTPLGTSTFITGRFLGLMNYTSTAGSYDLMGTGYANIAGPSGLSAYSKLQMGWLNDSVIKTIPKNSIEGFHLYSLDLENISFNEYQIVKYVIDSNHFYLIEYRPSIGYDSQFSAEIYLWNVDLTKGNNQGRLTILDPSIISNTGYISTLPFSVFSLSVSSTQVKIMVDTKNNVHYTNTAYSASSYTYTGMLRGNIILLEFVQSPAMTVYFQYYNATTSSWVTLKTVSGKTHPILVYQITIAGDYRASLYLGVNYYYFNKIYQAPYFDINSLNNTAVTENNRNFTLSGNLVNTHEAFDSNAMVNLTLPTGLEFSTGEQSSRIITNPYYGANNYFSYHLKATQEVSDWLIFNFTSTFGSRLIYKLINITFQPDITHIADTKFEQGSTNEWLNWTITGQNPGNYTVYQDGSQIQFNNWTNNTQVNVSLDNLVFGYYNFTIQARTASIYFSTDTVFVNVTDTTLPTISHVSNRTQLYDSVNNVLNWTVFDLNPSNYSIFVNGIQKNSSTWSGSFITYYLDGLRLGLYNVTIVVEDKAGNKNFDTSWTTVVDGTKPALMSSSGNINIQLGTNEELYWVITDLTPDYYILYKNGSVIYELMWTNMTRVSVLTGSLGFGTYNYTLVAFDQYNNSAVYTQFVTVTDSVDPVVMASSGNVTVLPGVNQELYWVIADLSPNYYILYQNGSIIRELQWTNMTRVSIWTGSLNAGYYNFTIAIFDGNNNEFVSTLWLTVSDTSPPALITSSGNLIVEYKTNAELFWVISDYAPNNYTLYVNGTIIYELNWVNMTRVSVWTDSLGFGTYNYTLVVFDQFNNENIFTLWVKIVDTNPPLVSSSSGNLIVNYGTNSELYWVITDLSPNYYILYENGSIIQELPWNNETIISVWSGSLGFGTYNYTLIAFDGANNSLVSSQWITVEDLIPPIIMSRSGNLSINYGTNSELYWVIADLTPNYYILYDNGSVVQELPWNNQTVINIWSGSLGYGTYNYTLVAFDGAKNYLISTQWIVVVDTEKPIITTNSSYLEVVDGKYNPFFLNWTVSGQEANFFVIYQNGTTIMDGTWKNDSVISYLITSLPASHSYNFTLVITGLSGFSTSNTIMVKVDIMPDSIAPQIQGDFSNITVNEGFGPISRNWNITDAHPGLISIYCNDILTSQSRWINDTNYIFSVTNLTAGIYNYRIAINDSYGNQITKFFQIIVNAKIVSPNTVNNTVTRSTTTTVVSTTTESSSASQSSTKPKSSGGFELIGLLLAIPLFVLIKRRK